MDEYWMVSVIETASTGAVWGDVFDFTSRDKAMAFMFQQRIPGDGCSIQLDLEKMDDGEPQHWLNIVLKSDPLTEAA
jgi:hypothetical protein